MQDKAAFGVDRAALQYRLTEQVFAAQGQFELVKQMAQTHVSDLVDDQTHGATLVVFTHIDDAAPKKRVLQTRHGHQKMVREVDGGRIGRHGLRF